MLLMNVGIAIYGAIKKNDLIKSLTGVWNTFDNESKYLVQDRVRSGLFRKLRSMFCFWINLIKGRVNNG